MSKTDKPEIVVALEELFSEINKSLFKGELKLPTMILQPERRLDFNFVGDTYHFVIGGRFSEIESVVDMHARFLHEMLHVKLPEQSDNSSNYHNAKFLEAALEVGFYVGRNRTVGWGLTFFAMPAEDDSVQKVRVPSVDAIQMRKNFYSHCTFDEDAFTKSKKNVVDLQKKTGRTKQYFLKYVCKCPGLHNSIRSGRRPDSQNPLNNFCGDCGYSYICVESGRKSADEEKHVHMLDFVKQKFNVGEGFKKSV